MSSGEAITFVQTKTGIRCCGPDHWAEGTTKEEAESNYRGMTARKNHIRTNIAILDKLFCRIPQPA